mmetsp:Transcript_104155/g.222546  ORF Transcript_104155/g.222546 Transcript_104155/m.222546 type:complete len:366 (+) Transcript_104155:554-1651(+)
MLAKGARLDQRLATEAPDALLHELCQRPTLRRRGVQLSGVRSAEELGLRLGLVAHDGSEDSHQRLLELVLNVVLRVDGEAVFQRIERILALLVAFGAFGSSDHDIRHAVSAPRRIVRIPLPHALGQFHVRLFGCVVLSIGTLAQGLRDHQQGEVDLVLQQVADDVLDVAHGPRDGLVDEDCAQARLHDLAHKAAVVAADGLNALGVELVVGLGPRPIEPGIALLVHEQVREVDLLELELDGLDEGGTNHVSRLLSQLHGLLDSVHSELHHHGVSVAIDDLGIVSVPLLNGVLRLHEVLGVVDHLAAEGRDTGRYLQARKNAHSGTREAVDGVGGDLQCQLPTVENGLREGVLSFRHGALRLLPSS